MQQTNGTTQNQKATTIISQTTDTHKDFDTLKRNFEHALYNGKDYTNELTELSTAIATACLNKCIDPQRSTAPTRDTISNNGFNPALTDLKRGIWHDTRLLQNTRTTNDNTTALLFDIGGDFITEVVDKEAKTAIDKLIQEVLSDGIDLVHTAIVALLEETMEHAHNIGWLDEPYTTRRLSKKVYIQLDDSAQYTDLTTTPMQEVYRAVRRTIQSSRAMQTDPRNGYTYIEDLTADGLDTIYHRLQKWADLGGHDTNGYYTGDKQTTRDYNNMIEALQLTDRQLTVVNLRMRGYGYKAISSYLGVTPRAIAKTLELVQHKATICGFTNN